jgi:colanic acid/amylovoran biosynthesis protein
MSEHHGFLAVILNQVSDDIPMALEVARRSRTRVFVDRSEHEPEILRRLIARSTVFLGTRFHSCIFAMLAHRPTFAISYLPKTSGILSAMNLEERSVPIDEIISDYVIKSIERDIENIDLAEASIAKRVYAYRRDHIRFYDVIRNLVTLQMH